MAYLDQLGRVRRFLARLSEMRRASDEYDDDLWSYFQHCYHLRDWIINDPAVPKLTKDAIVVGYSAIAELEVCGDLANGTKHSVLQHKDSRPVSRNVTVGGGENFQEWIIATADGRQYKSLELATACLQKWEALLTATGLPIV